MAAKTTEASNPSKLINLGKKMFSDSDEGQKLSPMMIQWQACKKAAGDAVLLFRMGDFYEAFYEDAATLAREADLTLTKRQGIPMSGIPWHTSEGYIDKLIGKGLKVAVAEQTEDPKLTKGLVKREIVRVVTPGTLINSSLLSETANNFFATITRVGAIYGFAYLDITTTEFRAIECEKEQDLLNEIYKVRPSEILISQKLYKKEDSFFNELQKSYPFLLNTHDDWNFEHQIAYDFLISHFKVHNLDGFGLKGMTAAINAAGALLKYLQENLCLNIAHLSELSTYRPSHYMSIDRTTQKNLELTEALNESGRKNTLLGMLDRTLTPMGARLIRQWIKQPLLSLKEIHRRQEAVALLKENLHALKSLKTRLNGVRDLERLIMRINSNYATPRDLLSLKVSLEPIFDIKNLLKTIHGKSSLLDNEEEKLDSLPLLTQLISTAIVEDPPVRLSEGGIFREGYHSLLDELRSISHDSKSWIARYQTELRETTGIKTLKVSFTRMFGYYIEVSKGQAEKMPEQFQRRQTLVNAERFITPELKDYENKVLNAEERMIAIEAELFSALRQEIVKYTHQIMQTAHAVACIDSIRSLADVAEEHHYICPTVDDSSFLKIESGRHPVIEALNVGEKFVPNDTFLDDDKNRLFLITGPNMAGKSTYIRQVALIVIMAQIGAFIPAKSARIGIVDKVFTRIGASDDLSRGQSTFMVEMTETANILHHATSRSLVILDEIGRGTSTYDGISIAWAVAEHLLTTEGKMPKTLFATHYWELTKLEEKVPGAVNYNVAVHESEDQILFLRKIVKGGTDKSYGIHVGRLAGLPNTVINRAKEILVHLEENANRKNAFEPSRPKRSAAKPKVIIQDLQLTFFETSV